MKLCLTSHETSALDFTTKINSTKLVHLAWIIYLAFTSSPKPMSSNSYDVKNNSHEQNKKSGFNPKLHIGFESSGSEWLGHLERNRVTKALDTHILPAKLRYVHEVNRTRCNAQLCLFCSLVDALSALKYCCDHFHALIPNLFMVDNR